MGVPLTKPAVIPTDPRAPVHRAPERSWLSGRAGIAVANSQLDPLIDTLARAVERTATAQPAPERKTTGKTT